MTGRSRIRAAIDRTTRAASLLGGLATLAITGLISFDVLMRYLFNEPQLFVDELASFLQVLVVFGGLGYTFRTGGHVRVDLVITHLPHRARAWLRVLTLGLGSVILLLVMWITGQSVSTAYRYGRVSTVMLYPIWLPMALIPTGLALMAVAMLASFLRQFRAALVGGDEVSQRERQDSSSAGFAGATRPGGGLEGGQSPPPRI